MNTQESNCSRKYLQKAKHRNNKLGRKIYTLTRKITIDSYSRIFLYKILNNILYVNKSLYRMKVLDSPLCCLCNAEDETIIHLFSKSLVQLVFGGIFKAGRILPAFPCLILIRKIHSWGS